MYEESGVQFWSAALREDMIEVKGSRESSLNMGKKRGFYVD